MKSNIEDLLQSMRIMIDRCELEWHLPEINSGIFVETMKIKLSDYNRRYMDIIKSNQKKKDKYHNCMNLLCDILVSLNNWHSMLNSTTRVSA